MSTGREQDDHTEQQQNVDELSNELSNVNISNDEIQIANIAIQEFTQAFESTFFPTIEAIDSQLDEINRSQTLLLELIREQNANWKHMAYAKELERIFNKIPLYLQKTRDTSKRMAMISDRKSVV